jgi:hypothetical protein
LAIVRTIVRTIGAHRLAPIASQRCAVLRDAAIALPPPPLRQKNNMTSAQHAIPKNGKFCEKLVVLFRTSTYSKK